MSKALWKTFGSCDVIIPTRLLVGKITVRTESPFSATAMETHEISALAWERMVTAVEKVRDRLRRATQALEQAQIPYAVAGGNAVAAWVSEVDEAAVRNTQD